MPLYRTAKGEKIDMSVLSKQNEKVRAIGNMNVNARGDILDSNNKVIQDNTKRVKTVYTRTTNNNQPKPQRSGINKPVQPIANEELTQEEREFEDFDEHFERKDIEK